MRRPGSRVHPYSACVAVLLAAATCGSLASAAGLDSVDAERLTLTGRVLVETIDARHVLVAIATRMDGTAEHVFLYTASTPLISPPRTTDWLGTLYYESGGGLRLIPASGDARTLEFVIKPAFTGEQGAGSAVTRFSDTSGLTHYLANPRLHIETLKAFHKTGDCNSTPQACVDVGGQSMPFPG